MLVAVIFEAASTEKCLIGVQGLTTCERRNIRPGENRRSREAALRTGDKLVDVWNTL